MQHAEAPLKVLIAGAPSAVSPAVRAALSKNNLTPIEAGAEDIAIKELQEHTYAFVFLMFAKSTESERLISEIKAVAPDTVIFMFVHEVTDDAIRRALVAGAYECLALNVDAAELSRVLFKAGVRENVRSHFVAERAHTSQRMSFAHIIAHSASMKAIFESIRRLAPFHTTVLITGESGTGKELLAQAIHHNSPRRGKAFVAINCGAIPEHLLESELFGHKKGAFTDATRDKRGLLEEAGGGTVFLDEIGEMPLHLQVKLLRALQERCIRRVGDEQLIEVDVRVIAATLRDLEQDVRIGRFRDDLFYRLNVVSIHLPALRERPEDIPPLINHFIKKHSKRLSLPVMGVSPAALELLQKYPWKGNVRELENCIERAMVLSESAEIDVDSLPPKIGTFTANPNERSAMETAFDEGNLSIKQHTRTLEISLIKRALDKTGGNRTRAAKILEISHRALLYKLKEYGLVKKGEVVEVPESQVEESSSESREGRS